MRNEDTIRFCMFLDKCKLGKSCEIVKNKLSQLFSNFLQQQAS